MDKKKVGEILSAKRTGLGLSSEEMAQRIQCNRTTVERMENGTTTVMRTKLSRIAHAYEMGTKELAELCGYPVESLTADLNDAQITASVSDLEFLLTVARGLQTPMNLNVIRELLRRRQEK